MKTYSLFSEHLNMMIFGKTEEDALTHCGPLPTQGTYDKDSKQYTKGPEWRIKHLLGRADTSHSTRGNYDFVTIIAAVTIEGEDGILYKGIDVRK